ncbi:hypothetical protein ACVDG3_14305 [Meridianimarinicoccus sp. RP-17]|uniref:hypothetical protein n=1 Tax=Meridianimarinicoccus zhengii TaxID=2056810 RepID=UPI000DAB6AC2|nr:hypothetical protein [Phycocomes zhengii]
MGLSLWLVTTGLLAAIVWAAPAAAQNSTTIEGPILFLDTDGKPIAPPYDAQILDNLLAAETLEYDTRKPRGVPPDVKIDPFEDEIIRYRYTVQLRRAGLWLRLDFNYDGFEAREEIDLFQHRGTMPDRELAIQRRYPDRVSRVRAVMQGLAAPDLLENDIDRTLRLIEGLINDPLSEGSDVETEAVERYQDYMRAVELMERVMRQGKPLSPEVALRVSELPRRIGFSILPVQEQFDTLGGFAFWFARSPTPGQQIESTLTHRGLARQFFEEAYELAYAVNDSAPVDATALIRTLQEYYMFMCPTAAEIDGGAAAWDSACFYALYDAGSFPRDFSARTYRAILQDFHTHLERASRPETGWATECGYRRKIAAERGDMAEYWELYADLADAIADRHRRLAIELSSDRDFAGMSYIAQTRDRARDIVALGRGGEMITPECAPASAGAVLPVGDEL